jgi:prophage regulatory protein
MTPREQHLATLAALPPATAADDRLIPIARVEQIAGIMRSRIYQLIRQGSFPAPYKPGGFASRWSEAGVRGWVESLKVKAA